jgi:ATP-binding cassette subfamily F protein 3
MRSKDVLKAAIRDFDGTVIVVSHDREFLDGLVTKVYEFGGGKVREHLGGIYDYLTASPIPSKGGGNRPTASQFTPPLEGPGEASGSALYAEQKALAREQKRKEKALQEAEEKVTQLEAAIRILEDQMSTPEGSQDVSLYEKHGRLKAQLKKAEEEWEALI